MPGVFNFLGRERLLLKRFWLVPELTPSAGIQLNARVSLRCPGSAQFPDGLTMARPSGDHNSALGGFVFYVKEPMRQTWMMVNYILAITVAMIGWLCLIAWIAMRLF
jgi:hypothetical protein